MTASDENIERTINAYEMGGAVWQEAFLPLGEAYRKVRNTARFLLSVLFDFDPMKVTSCVTAQLPVSTQEVFEVLGGPSGAVQYSVLTRSPQGGQLVIMVAGDGSVLASEPIDAAAQP